MNFNVLFHSFTLSLFSGALDFGELCAALASLHVDMSLCQTRRLFSAIDDNGDKTLTLDELEAHVRRWRKAHASMRDAKVRAES